MRRLGKGFGVELLGMVVTGMTLWGMGAIPCQGRRRILANCRRLVPSLSLEDLLMQKKLAERRLCQHPWLPHVAVRVVGSGLSAIGLLRTARPSMRGRSTMHRKLLRVLLMVTLLIPNSAPWRAMRR